MDTNTTPSSEYQNLFFDFLESTLTTFLSRSNDDAIQKEKNFNDIQNILYGGNNANMDVWIDAFTHPSIDPNNNYQLLEFFGDQQLNTAFVTFLDTSGILETPEWKGIKVDENAYTILTHKYMSSDFQSNLAIKYQFNKYIRVDSATKDKKIYEDVFESFFGAIYKSCINVWQDPSRCANYAYRIIFYMFKDVRISPNDIKGDSKTRVKEVTEKNKWLPSSGLDAMSSWDDNTGTFRIIFTDYPGNSMKQKLASIVPEGEIVENRGSSKRKNEILAYDRLLDIYKQLGYIAYNPKVAGRNIRANTNPNIKQEEHKNGALWNVKLYHDGKEVAHGVNTDKKIAYKQAYNMLNNNYPNLSTKK